MSILRLLVTIGVVIVSLGWTSANAQALSKIDAKQRFSKMVLKNIGKKNRGGTSCVQTKSDHFRCTGRWQRKVKSERGGRIILIVRARGRVFEDAEKIRASARLTKWKIVRGVRKGPFRGAFLMSTQYKPSD